VADTTTTATSTAPPVVTAPPVSAPASSSNPVSAPTRTAAPAQSFASPEAIAALTGMGFPESESRSALEAAMGNPDLAYEFLLNGIPEQALAASRMRQGAPAAGNPPPAASNTTSGTSALQAFRSHPQFEALKQLVQSNPAALPQVLNLIGQQNPQLLEAIHTNNDEFLSMMNEPLGSTPAPTTPPAVPPTDMPGMGDGPNPAQIVALLSALPPEQRAAFAQQVGLSPEQLNAFMQMVATLPPEQLQQLMPGAGGGGGGGGGGHVIRLTEEEHAAVTRLTQLGFSQQQAVQAYLACDKNEALAANLLFDGGFGFDDEDGGMGGGGYGDFGDDGGDDYN
jgi:UV excision repair protein RAD23